MKSFKSFDSLLTEVWGLANQWTAVAMPLAALLWATSAAAHTPLWNAQVQDAGVALAVRIDGPAGLAPLPQGQIPAGRNLDLRLLLSDEAASQPLRGIRPRAWLSRMTADPPEPCADQVRRFVAGRFVARADRDLNGWQVLTLNGDASLSVINPQVSVGSTRLESLVTLPGTAAEGVHLAGPDRLLLTLPGQGLVVVVDMGSFKVLHRIEVGGAPRRLVVTPDEKRAFVAIDDSSRLVMIDLEHARVARTVDIGEGLHGLTLALAGQRVVATSTTAGQVTVLDAQTAEPLARHKVTGTPLAVTASALSGRVYVARVHEDSLATLDARSGERRSDIPFGPRVTALRADPSGRWVLGIDGPGNKALILDAARDRLLGAAQTVEQPDQVVFTRRFAYVRGLSSLSVSLIDLEALGRGEVAETRVPMYQKRPDAVPGEVGVADMIAPMPDGGGVLVANGADTALYGYMEGMQAPQGTYRTYSRAARGVIVLDRALREVAAGEFSNRFRLDRGGRYSLAVLVDQPRVVRCFDVAVDDSGLTVTGSRIALRHEAPPAERLIEDGAVTLRVRLADAETQEPLIGLDDVQLMILEMPGISQQRRFMREVAPGVYEVEHRFPRPGAWRAMAQIASRGLSFERAPTLDLQIRPKRSTQQGGAPMAASPSSRSTPP